MLPFDLLEHEEQATVDRALGVEPKWNAWVELHNLIVAAETAHDFGPGDVRRIGREHGVNFYKSFRAEQRNLYSAYLDYCLDNGDLADAERDVLARLAHTLILSSHDLQPVHERAFGRTVSDVLSDDCVTIEERLLLYKLQHTFGLEADLADATYEEMARAKLLKAVAHALCDGMLSPDERKHIEALEAEFGVDIPPSVASLLEQAADAWAILHGSLPRVDVGLRLLPGEVGHFLAPGKWKRLNYARLRVLLGSHRARFNLGDTEGLRIPAKALWGRQREGQIVVVSKRLVLITRRSDLIAYRLSSLRAIERYANGLRVGLPDNHSLFIDAGRANRVLYSILDRLMSGSRS